MNIQSIIVLVLILFAAGVALWVCICNKKNGKSCCGGTCSCQSCKGSCNMTKKD